MSVGVSLALIVNHAAQCIWRDLSIIDSKKMIGRLIDLSPTGGGHGRVRAENLSPYKLGMGSPEQSFQPPAVFFVAFVVVFLFPGQTSSGVSMVA